LRLFFLEAQLVLKNILNPFFLKSPKIISTKILCFETFFSWKPKEIILSVLVYVVLILTCDTNFP